MQPRPTSQTVASLLENARLASLDATGTFLNDLEKFAAEAANLSRLDVLPVVVRASLSRLDQLIRNEIGNINSYTARNTQKHEPREPSRIHLLPPASGSDPQVHP